jgi:hypothetical protein
MLHWIWPGDELLIIWGFRSRRPLGDQTAKDSCGQHHVKTYHQGSDDFHVVFTSGINLFGGQSPSKDVRELEV